MPFDDLRQWIAALDRAGELKRVQTEVDPILEIAEITDRASKSRDSKGAVGGSALLFENIKGQPGAKVLINQFGSEARMNTPSQPENNWAWRYEEGALRAESAAQLAVLMEMTDRDGYVEPDK